MRERFEVVGTTGTHSDLRTRIDASYLGPLGEASGRNTPRAEGNPPAHKNPQPSDPPRTFPACPISSSSPSSPSPSASPSASGWATAPPPPSAPSATPPPSSSPPSRRRRPSATRPMPTRWPASSTPSRRWPGRRSTPRSASWWRGPSSCCRATARPPGRGWMPAVRSWPSCCTPYVIRCSSTRPAWERWRRRGRRGTGSCLPRCRGW